MLKKLLGKSTTTTKSYIEIKQQWQRIQSLDVKNRFKLMRAIAHDICEIFKKNDSELEQLEFYIAALKKNQSSS